MRNSIDLSVRIPQITIVSKPRGSPRTFKTDHDYKSMNQERVTKIEPRVKFLHRQSPRHPES